MHAWCGVVWYGAEGEGASQVLSHTKTTWKHHSIKLSRVQ